MLSPEKASPNSKTRRMLAWLLRHFAQRTPVAPAGVHLRLQAARRLVQQRKEINAPTGIPTEKSLSGTGREILPSAEHASVIPYRLLDSPTAPPVLAAALESVLQGRRVGPDVFTQLYRSGSVFRDPQGRWAITEMGKQLIERNKLFTPHRCLVAGVECAGAWTQ